MKPFLQQLGKFLAVLLLLNILLYFISKQLYFKDYHDYSLNYKSYLFADSHGAPLEQSTQAFGVYNFSAKSDSYFDMVRKLRFLVRNTKIDTVYLTADDHTLSPYRESANNMDGSEFYLSRSDYPNYYEYWKNQYLIPHVIFLQPKALSVIRIFIFSEIKKLMGGKKSDKRNGISEWMQLNEKERKEKSRVRANEQFPPGEPSEKLSTTLAEIIQICKENKIVLIGVKFPLTADYIQAQGSKSFKAEEVIRTAGFEVQDFTEVFKDNSDCFENQDHLNEAGGKKFVKEWLGK